MLVVTSEATNWRISEIFKILCHNIKVRQVTQVKLYYSVKLNSLRQKKRKISFLCSGSQGTAKTMVVGIIKTTVKAFDGLQE